MNHNIHNPQEIVNCQAPCNCKIDFSMAVRNSTVGRRKFLKQTGGATLATALSLHGSRVQVQAAGTTHCPQHGGGPCTFISSISVEFTSAAPVAPALNPDGSVYRKSSGRRFSGTMTINYSRCDGSAAPNPTTMTVFSGGHIDPPATTDVRQPNSSANPPVNDDTSIPAGNYQMGDTQTGGNTRGYGINGQMGARSNLEQHSGNCSTGCVVSAAGNTYTSLTTSLAANAACRCAPETIPYTVSYNLPQGTPLPTGNLGNGNSR
jgi:hypothetical protein